MKVRSFPTLFAYVDVSAFNKQTDLFVLFTPFPPPSGGNETEIKAIGLRAQTELQSDIIREQVDLIAQRTVEARQWEERAKVLESSNDKFKKEYSNLKMLLKKSESMWHQGQSALDKLKKEFQNLAVDISEQEGLLFQKYASPDRRLAYINADTRRQVGSKSLSTLMKLLESPRTMEAVENLTSETSSRSWHEAYYLER